MSDFGELLECMRIVGSTSGRRRRLYPAVSKVPWWRSAARTRVPGYCIASSALMHALGKYKQDVFCIERALIPAVLQSLRVIREGVSRVRIRNLVTGCSEFPIGGRTVRGVHTIEILSFGPSGSSKKIGIYCNALPHCRRVGISCEEALELATRFLLVYPTIPSLEASRISLEPLI
eukprot:2327943-Rhodomonas_salina.1